MANRGSWNHWAAWEELLWLVSCGDPATLEDDVRAMRARLDDSDAHTRWEHLANSLDRSAASAVDTALSGPER
jgi:hypothetical protein